MIVYYYKIHFINYYTGYTQYMTLFVRFNFRIKSTTPHYRDNVPSSRHNRGMLYDSGTILVQVYDIHVQLLEDEVGDVCYTRTTIRQYQRPCDA